MILSFSHASYVDQLLHRLNQVAESMRNCATVAEQFAQTISGMTPGANDGQVISPLVRKRKGQALDDGQDEGKKKRIRKPRYPNAPKRPASSYILYQNEVRPELKEKHPAASHNDLLHMISKRWAAMSDADKEVSVRPDSPLHLIVDRLVPTGIQQKKCHCERGVCCTEGYI